VAYCDVCGNFDDFLSFEKIMMTQIINPTSTITGTLRLRRIMIGGTNSR